MMDCALPPVLILERRFRAPPEQVWAAWTDPAILPRWFGPAGFTCRTHDIDLREGGLWRFDMIGPDGMVWPNRHRFTLYRRPEEIRFLMDDDGRGPNPPFAVVVTLEATDGGTLLTQTITFPSETERQAAIAMGAVELGLTTLAKLARELGEA
jgi:uncharacterized protein YndB with AHSA1/START domain